MRKVIHQNLDTTTQKNLLKYKKELVTEIGKKKKSKKKVDDLVDKYKADNIKPGIRSTLDEMQDFHGEKLCCYCERKMPDNFYNDIEHIKPKSKYPENALDRENMLLCCNVCNREYKNDKFNEGFLNPRDNNYVFENHFGYTKDCFYIKKTEEAKITEKLMKLDNGHSFKERLKFMKKITDQLVKYNGKQQKTILEYIEDDIKKEGQMETFGKFLLSHLIEIEE